MGKNKEFTELLSELEPLINYLSGTSNYKKLRFTQSDMVGFFNEKVYHVWLKYNQTLEYSEVKAISIAALYNVRGKVYQKYSREISMEVSQEEALVDEVEVGPSFDLLEEAKKYLTKDQAFILDILVDPPLYIKEKAVIGKRIPSNLVLEYLDMGTDKKSVKLMNTFRRDIISTIRAKAPVCS